MRWLGSSLRLKELAEKCRRFTRDTDDLVRCLTIKLEIELGPGLAITPVGKVFEFAPPQRPLCELGASNDDAHPRRWAGHAALLSDRLSEGDDAPRDEPLSTIVLACEHENGVTCGDQLAPIHRLLSGERERLRMRIANLGFDRKGHLCPGVVCCLTGCAE